MNRTLRRVLNSINYRLITPLTGGGAGGSPKTDFKKTHNWLVGDLGSAHSQDEAVRMAVGGDFEAIGVLERETLIHHGLRPDDYLIDVGCGSGRLAKPLSEYLRGEYLGLDVVPELLAYARRLVARPDWRFELTDGLKVPEEDGRADMVCFFSVLTHLLHEESYVYLGEAKRVLRPGGKVVFSFLEFGVPSHWQVFEGNVRDRRVESQPLNVFLCADAIREWAAHLDLEVESIRRGDDPYVPLRHPVTFDGGSVVKDRGCVGQSVCVLART